MKSCADQIAASMNAYLNDPANQAYGVRPLNKQASAPEENDVEMQTELTEAWDLPETTLDIETKEASQMDDNRLIKSAFDKLMEASADLEDAGFDVLSANALVLVNHLVVEAKAKKNKMTDKQQAAFDKMKDKEKFSKLKDKEKAEKDKNDARDKKVKEKEKMAKERDEQKKKLEKMQEKANKKKAE